VLKEWLAMNGEQVNALVNDKVLGQAAPATAEVVQA